MLKLLVDENLGRTIVFGLREKGFHVESVVEEIRGAEDKEVIDFAKKRRKIVITQE